MTELRPSVAWVDGAIEIIDQTSLPIELDVRALRTVEDAIEAIQRLAVRGAPAIGACGALAMVVGLNERRPTDRTEAIDVIDDLVATIGAARPTAVNLSWAVERVAEACRRAVTASEFDLATVSAAGLAEALDIIEQDRDACTRIGEFGRDLLVDASRLMTHCNTGRLATAGWGTALGIVYAKAAAGQPVEVFASETRPLLQGARLTAWELADAGIDVTIFPDGASATLLSHGMVDAVIVGADRIAANGDTANKIGTHTHAVMAHHAGVPFVVAAPLSTFDLTIVDGTGIIIEQRPADELRQWRSEPTAPVGAATFNPAFDVTPAELITAIVTEVGVLEPPFRESIAAAFKKTGDSA